MAQDEVDLINQENAREGTDDWHLERVEKNAAMIEGYATKLENGGRLSKLFMAGRLAIRFPGETLACDSARG